MNPPLAERLRAPLRASKKPDFNVVRIYEDLAAGKRAEYFHETLIGEMEGDCDLNRNLWSFDFLEQNTSGFFQTPPLPCRSIIDSNAD